MLQLPDHLRLTPETAILAVVVLALVVGLLAVAAMIAPLPTRNRRHWGGH